jgi:MoaA/NifB/PqqE/SkfB family radical SAM enzyme
MGAPKPWPTRWPRPSESPSDEPIEPRDWPVLPHTLPQVKPPGPSRPLPEERWPASVTWGVTRRCNLHCRLCYDADGPQRRDLTTRQAFSAIDKLQALGVGLVAFSGGEPLMRDDLVHLMGRCARAGMRIALRSNGTFITRVVARRLADAGLEVAGISLDGATAAGHECIRGAGTFARTLAGIDALLQVGIRVNIEIVLTRRNASESLAMVELAESLGVHEINFASVAPLGRARDSTLECLDHPTWRSLVEGLHFASLLSEVTVSPSCALVGPCAACVEPNVTCDGWLTPCYLSPARLCHLLETDTATIRRQLSVSRPLYQNACGRGAWIRTPATSIAPSFRSRGDRPNLAAETDEIAETSMRTLA